MRFGSLAWVAVVFVLTGGLARGDRPPVEFDLAKVYSWKELSPPRPEGKAAAAEERKPVLVVIPISANFNVEEKEVPRIRYELRVPPEMDIIDFLPHSQGGTDVGEVNVRDQKMTDGSVRIKWGGQVGAAGEIWGAKLSLGGGGERESNDRTVTQTDVSYTYRPAIQQIVVAGTREERKVLYFDLNYHSQVLRAGESSFAILASVPAAWQHAVIEFKGVAGSTGAGQAKSIGLYREGDAAARKEVTERVSKFATADGEEIVTNAIGIKLRLLPEGDFEMGSPGKDEDAASRDDERPRHRRHIPAFRMGVTEVTVGQFRKFVAETGYKTQAERENDKETWSNPGYAQTDNHPVVYVSWNDAVAFCNWLSKLEGRTRFFKIDGATVTIADRAANGYRLPTEAEWEYACRAGMRTRYSCLAGDLGDHAWYRDNETVGTHPVGEKKPNAFGLYDMHGNVGEWCWDFFNEHYYESSKLDLFGPSGGSYRVIRGGSWCSPADDLRAASRAGVFPRTRFVNHGFRLARNRD